LRCNSYVPAEITGFVSNVANDDSAGVYIANRMASFRFSHRFRQLAKQPGHSFRTYCSMAPDHDSGLMRGDVYILNDDDADLVAAIYGVQFKKVPVRVLETLLFGRSSKATPAKSAGPSRAPTTATATAATTKKTKVKTKVAKASRHGAAAETIRSVLAMELGLDTVEEHVPFAELGLDSLMSIVILGSLREQLPQEIDLAASFFLDNPTMAEVRTFMARELPDGDVGASEADDEEEAPEVPTKSRKGKSAARPAGAAVAAVETIKGVLCTELGVTPADVEAGTEFAELGLDSLMSIVILGSLREHLPAQIDLPASFFLDYPTLSAVRDFMVRELGEVGAEGDDGEEEDEVDVIQQDEEAAEDEENGEESSDVVSSAMDATRQIVVTELGIDEAELKPDTLLAHLGLDSLMALLIRASVSEAVPFEIPATMFLDCPTLRDIEQCYIDIAGPPVEKRKTKAVAVAPPPARAPAVVLAPPPAVARSAVDIKPSKPVCLIPSKGEGAGKHPIFLFPDGSGNAAVYAAMTDVGRPVYGVSSPFVRDATHWTGGMEQLAELYIQSMKMQQPRGPYIIGGQSILPFLSFAVLDN
jgi:acyl carrier protein